MNHNCEYKTSVLKPDLNLVMCYNLPFISTKVLSLQALVSCLDWDCLPQTKVTICRSCMSRFLWKKPTNWDNEKYKVPKTLSSRYLRRGRVCTSRNTLWVLCCADTDLLESREAHIVFYDSVILLIKVLSEKVSTSWNVHPLVL